MSLTGLTSLWRNSRVTINSNDSAPLSSRLSMLPLNSPPINGYSAERDLRIDRRAGSGRLWLHLEGQFLPRRQHDAALAPQRFSVGIFDTGSRPYITENDAFAFDIEGANRLGNSESEIGGVGGTEIADVTDGLGVYVTSIANGNTSSGTITVPAGSVKGQWNASILTGPHGQLAAEHPGLPDGRAVSDRDSHEPDPASQRRLDDVPRPERRSPARLDTALPAGYFRLTLGVESVNGISPEPVFFPSLENLNNVADNPVTPTFWASFIASASAAHTGGSARTTGFLFDTGAEVTVVSEDTAARLATSPADRTPARPKLPSPSPASADRSSKCPAST